MVIMIPANLSMVIYFISQTTSTISLYVSWPQDLIMAFFFLFGFSNKKGVQPVQTTKRRVQKESLKTDHPKK